MLEKEIEKQVCTYATRLGLLVYKFTSPARRGVPDRLFIVPHKCVFFIEFKRTGEVATPAQEREHARLREAGLTVYVIDSVSAGMAAINDQIMGWVK